MLILGYMVTIIYKIMTVCAGTVLTVRPGQMRWHNRWAKILLAVLLGSAAVFRCVCTFWTKYSAMEVMAVALYLLAVLTVFFRGNIWQLLAQHFACWCNILVLEYCLLYVSCCFEKMSFWEYSVHYGVVRSASWSVFHLTAEIAACAGLIIFAKYFPGDRGLIQCRKNFAYLWVLALICGEGMFFYLGVDTEKYVYRVPEDSYILFLGIFITLLILFVLFGMALKAYFCVREKDKLSEINYQFLSRQYDMLHQMYEEKRQQSHDGRNHLILLEGYLREERTAEAKNYIHQLLNRTEKAEVQSRTGISAIDFMVNYKLSQALAANIRISLDLDVLFCPVKDQDMCVLLGNLLDNAIEAVEPMDMDKRIIKIVMSTKRNMLLITIINPYEGRRKKSGGRYETTKLDKKDHGFGLDSVEKIVKKYDGYFEIVDDGKIFEVRAVFYYRRQ